MKNNNLVCAECSGSKGEMVTTIVERPDNGKPMEISKFMPCWNCAGTGFDSDEEPFERFWREP
jgi:hypothetical protein